MDYNDAIVLCIDFIEKNIKSELTPEIIANKCGYSTFHFSRVFNIDQGMTLMEYVIKQTWKYIFEDWFKDSQYIFDETKLDFEYYDERCHKAIGTVMDIYVPVVKKKA